MRSPPGAASDRQRGPERSELQFSLSPAVSAKLQVETLQIGFNLCFALPIIDPQSCMANGDEWALDGPGWEEGHGVINGDLLNPWIGQLRHSAGWVLWKWASPKKKKHEAEKMQFLNSEHKNLCQTVTKTKVGLSYSTFVFQSTWFLNVSRQEVWFLCHVILALWYQ